ncbi:MAG TPA: tetratricopeptide repeat protein [Chloroflexota bacterium]
MDATLPTCSSCSHVNPPGSRFCSHCGSRLAAICPACAAENAPGSRFCNQCGTALTAAPASGPTDDRVKRSVSVPAPVAPSARVPASQTAPPHPEERRPVTSLFCDLVGFTPLTERLDAEEVRDIQERYFAAMREQIARFGGRVEKYVGDAVLAFFGAPLALEDDPERAVLCALGMQGAMGGVQAYVSDRYGVELAIRVGVNTGEVVSGAWEIGGRIDLNLTGDAINTAARLQTAAEPGGVLVGAETMMLTRRRIEYGDRLELTLKGKSATVPAYPALRVRERLGERWDIQQVTPLIGRDREVFDLMNAWAGVQEGEGRLITIVGDAGVGKSRLINEFVSRLSIDEDVRTVRGRCLSYGKEVSLWLVGDLLRNLFGIRESDGLEEVQNALRGALAELLDEIETTTRDEAVDVLGEVLGLTAGSSTLANAGAEIRRQALIRSLRLLLTALQTQPGAVLILEDLHWIDEASQEVLAEVLQDIPGLRMVVLAVQRPGWMAPWAEWGFTDRITLRPLENDEATKLAGAVLGGLEPSRELEAYIADRAGGNPFFVEEMLRALQESGGLEQRDGQMFLGGGAAERLPTTLMGVLLARLDRLESEARTVAQVASVIGRSFAVRLLAQMVGRDQSALEQPLSTLQRAEIAYPRRSSDLEYVFKHVSMRETAYNTLLQKRRQELHLAAARAIASMYSSHEYAEMIANHYAKTEEHAEAAVWLEKAGDRAAAVYSTEIALAHYGQALARMQRTDADALSTTRLDEKLGGVLYIAGRYGEAIRRLDPAVEAYRGASDLEAAGRVSALVGMAHRSLGNVQEGLDRVRPMIPLLTPEGPSPALASLYLALAQLYFLAGQYAETLDAATQAAEYATAIGDKRLLGEAEERRGTALVGLGRPADGRSVIEGAIATIEETGNLAVLWRALNNLAYAADQQGKMRDVRHYTERALEVARQIGNPDQIAFILGNLGSTLITEGDWTAARQHLEQAIDLMGRDCRTANAANPLSYLGLLLLREGDWTEASRVLEEALEISREAGARQVQEPVETHLAELDLLQGRPRAALARLQALVAEETPHLGAQSLLAWTYLELDEPDAIDQAEAIVGAAVDQARSQGRNLALAEALHVQGTVHARLGRWDEAEIALTEGIELSHAIPYPYAEARTLIELASIRARPDASIDGLSCLHQALAIFRRLGAKKDVERAEVALAEYGISSEVRPTEKR